MLRLLSRVRPGGRGSERPPVEPLDAPSVRLRRYLVLWSVPDSTAGVLERPTAAWWSIVARDLCTGRRWRLTLLRFGTHALECHDGPPDGDDPPPSAPAAGRATPYYSLADLPRRAAA